MGVVAVAAEPGWRADVLTAAAEPPAAPDADRTEELPYAVLLPCATAVLQGKLPVAPKEARPDRTVAAVWDPDFGRLLAMVDGLPVLDGLEGLVASERKGWVRLRTGPGPALLLVPFCCDMRSAWPDAGKLGFQLNMSKHAT